LAEEVEDGVEAGVDVIDDVFFSLTSPRARAGGSPTTDDTDQETDREEAAA